MPFLIVNVLILFLHFNRIDRHAIYQVLGVGSIIFREIHIDKASKGMAIGANPNDSIFISMTIDDLLLKPSSFVTRAHVLAILSIKSIATKDSISLISIELLYCFFLFLLNFSLVLGLQFANLRIMTFFEVLVLFHNTVHVTIVYINHYNLFPFFKCLILILKSKLFWQLFLQTTPFVLIVELGAPSIIYSCLVSLIILWLISLCVWIEVECLLVIPVNDPSNCIFGIGSSVGFKCGFIKVVLIFGVGQWASIWFESLQVLFYFFASFLLSFCLLFKLSLPYTLSKLVI